MTFGTISCIGNSRQEKYFKEILHKKLCNMNSGYIHQTLINWALKMLISSIWGRDKVGEKRREVIGRKSKKLWKQTLSINS